MKLQKSAFNSLFIITIIYCGLSYFFYFGIFLILKWTGFYSKNAGHTEFSRVILPDLNFWGITGIWIVIILNFILCFYHILISFKYGFLIVDKKKTDKFGVAVIKNKGEIFLKAFSLIQLLGFFYFQLQFMYGNTGYFFKVPLKSPLFYLIPIQLSIFIFQLFLSFYSKKSNKRHRSESNHSP